MGAGGAGGSDKSDERKVDTYSEKLKKKFKQKNQNLNK